MPAQLELVNKYPPLRKEVEAFLGVPQTIDPPKRYPKTPIPGRKGAGIDKPAALLDDSATAAAEAVKWTLVVVGTAPSGCTPGVMSATAAEAIVHSAAVQVGLPLVTAVCRTARLSV